MQPEPQTQRQTRQDEAHPLQWQFADPGQRDRIQRNWERFLEANPAHRPGTGDMRRYPCIIHNIASGEPGHRCVPPCLSRITCEALRGLLDHTEPMHCIHEGRTHSVLFGHPYSVDQENATTAHHLQQLLKALPGGAGSKLAVYLSNDDEGWFTIPLPAVIIQHRSLPAIRGWLETTVDGSRMVPSDA